VHYDVALHRGVRLVVALRDEPLDAVHHRVRKGQHYAMRHRHLHLYCAIQRHVMLQHHYEMTKTSTHLGYATDYLYCVRQQDVLEAPSSPWAYSIYVRPWL
jgi:hypothetical protein